MFFSAKHANWTRRRFVSYLTFGFLTISIIGILMTRLSSDFSSHYFNPGSANSSSVSNPNIIILGSDGLSAKYLTAYGSTLQTTPFLNEVAQTSLVAENAFPNGGGTTASTTSVLTGKEPILAKVFR